MLAFSYKAILLQMPINFSPCYFIFSFLTTDIKLAGVHFTSLIILADVKQGCNIGMSPAFQ